MNKDRFVASVGLALGIAALSSALFYAITGRFWWTEVQRSELERGLLLFAAHGALIIAGIASGIALICEWLSHD